LFNLFQAFVNRHISAKTITNYGSAKHHRKNMLLDFNIDDFRSAICLRVKS